MKKNVILGTAGHVDHGKTSLIKALTGTDTDRLEEEKRRGITIELGFAHFCSPDGTVVGIVDVPGHEKFIANMLSGIGGIDIGLLVVAADEGIMPQTREHLDIMRLLNIKKGIIAITKADTEDEVWINMVREEITKLVRGSVFETAPVILTSAVTGQGIEELKNTIFYMADNMEPQNEDKSCFRLPVDRVFTVHGFGTVVTGTVAEGSVKAGQNIMLYPQKQLLKIRNIQVYGEDALEAAAGQRAALNIPDIKKEDIKRGNVLAAPGRIRPTSMTDVKLDILKDSGRIIKDGSRLHFYYGSAETMCKVVLMGKDKAEPGESCYAQLRFDLPVSLRTGDRFVVRYYSPLETVGGGRVLDPNPDKHKRNDYSLIEKLRIRDEGEPVSLLNLILKEKSPDFICAADIASEANIKKEEFDKAMMGLFVMGKAVSFNDGTVVHSDFLGAVFRECKAMLREYHEKNPLLKGMSSEELKNKLAFRFRVKNSDKMDNILKLYAEKGGIIYDSVAALSDFRINYTEKQLEIRERLQKFVYEKGLEGKNPDDLIKEFGGGKTEKQLLFSLISDGILVMLPDGTVLSHEIIKDTEKILVYEIKKRNGITLGEFRDVMKTSRKYALSCLEYFDSVGVTEKSGDKRILRL